MGPGRAFGGDRVTSVGFGIQTFVRRDGGYTTLATALALLVSVTLAFGTASAQWALARSADVQEVADATALAGENCVAAFSTVAQVLDACVLTMGLTGVVVCGAGLVVAAIPGLQEGAVPIMDAGRKVLDARRGFARSSARGLKMLEEGLPALIMCNSASCAAANSQGGMRYVGTAIPFPQTSQSDYSFLESEVTSEEMGEDAERLADATARKEEAAARANEAKERAWRADNVNDPMCLQSRAFSLAGLGDALNPIYPAPEPWEFEFARIRARNYYLRRYEIEGPSNGSVEELQRSAARKQFFGYAYEAVGTMWCHEDETSVSMNLQELPHTPDMVRATRLYTDVVWPCTADENGYVTLHCALECPGATDPYVGNASLSSIDAGAVYMCEVCRMDVRAMGNVADASTNINNGFEHYWRIVVRASRDYEVARNEEIEAEREMKEAAEQGKSAFDEAMDALKVDRPKLCPPGAWGCVGVVSRSKATSVPTELTAAFLSGTPLPRGVAVSGAVLAPDDATSRNTVLARAFDGLGGSGESLAVGVVGSVTGLWSDLLQGYGSAYESLEGAGGRFLQGIEVVFGEAVATWLRSKLTGLVSAAGFEPADLRLRKPVIVNSQTILDKAGYTTAAKAREVIQTLPTTPEELVAFLREKVREKLGSGPVTIAEVPIPGLEGVSIPLTIDLSQIGVL